MANPTQQPFPMCSTQSKRASFDSMIEQLLAQSKFDRLKGRGSASELTLGANKDLILAIVDNAVSLPSPRCFESWISRCDCGKVAARHVAKITWALLLGATEHSECNPSLQNVRHPHHEMVLSRYCRVNRRHSFRRLSTGPTLRIFSVFNVVFSGFSICWPAFRIHSLTQLPGSTSEDLEAAFNAPKPSSRKASKEAGKGEWSIPALRSESHCGGIVHASFSGEHAGEGFICYDPFVGCRLHGCCL